MVSVLALAGALWLLGRRFGVAQRARAMAILGLWVGVVALHLALPDAHPLRLATGGSAQVWLALAGVVALIAGYRAALARLRDRAPAPVAPTTSGAFRPAELDRYARHIMLREIGGTGQRRLKEARVLVVGAGGLGAPVLLYLAAAGVGTLGVIDDDVVENSNLSRQIIHADARIGMPKVASAEAAMRALNPFIVVRPYNRRLTDDIAAALFADYDLILDGSDNFPTRHLVNRTCVALQKPLIAGAITQWEGQVALYDPARGGPCFACVFPVVPAEGLAPSCAEAGVAGPLAGIVGAQMAMEAVKEITGAGQSLRAALLLVDALHGENRRIALRADPACPVCAGRGAAA